MAIKKDNTTLQKTVVYLHAKNRMSLISWDIAKILRTWYLGYFGQDEPQPWKTSGKVNLMFIYMQKINLFPDVFVEILHFKESWNLIGQGHFAS